MRTSPYVNVPDIANEFLLSRMGARRPTREEYSNEEVIDVVPQDKLTVLSDAGLSDSEDSD